MIMTRAEFELLVSEEFPRAVPEKFRSRIKNVGFLVDDEPSDEVRAEEGLLPDETLLGLYQGIPHTSRGGEYGVGVTLPDRITLYQKPIEEEAGGDVGEVRRVIRDTIWHEVAHHFGFSEAEVRKRERIKE